jgi:hypothetical protein
MGKRMVTGRQGLASAGTEGKWKVDRQPSGDPAPKCKKAGFSAPAFHSHLWAMKDSNLQPPD